MIGWLFAILIFYLFFKAMFGNPRVPGSSPGTGASKTPSEKLVFFILKFYL